MREPPPDRTPSEGPASTASDSTARIVAELAAALARDFGRPPLAQPGWRARGVGPRTFRRTVPVVTLERDGSTLCFIVTPTAAAEPAYRRTRHHDLTYFSEDVPDDQQQTIYARDRARIDAFAAWLAAIESPEGSFR